VTDGSNLRLPNCSPCMGVPYRRRCRYANVEKGYILRFKIRKHWITGQVTAPAIGTKPRHDVPLVAKQPLTIKEPRSGTETTKV
jgi:hypothetical protein